MERRISANVDHKNGYHVHRSNDGGWFWNYYIDGREISRSSEPYKSKADCRRSIDIMLASGNATVYHEDGTPEAAGILRPLR